MNTRAQNLGSQSSLLPRDEVAVRAPYWPLVEAGALTTIFRPGDRSCGHPKSYYPGETVTLRLLVKIGAEWANQNPIFDEGRSRQVIIKTQEVISVLDLQPEHFIGSSPDVQDALSLLYHLGVIYNMPLEEIVTVTRTTFSYIS